MATPYRLGWLLAGALLFGSALPGCELIVDFDRSKIGGDDTEDRPSPGEDPDAGEPDAGQPDAGEDDDDAGMGGDDDAGA